jgi:hypothetical protein
MIARRYTNRYLNTEKTLKEQDKLTVTLLLSYVSIVSLSAYMLL